MQVSRPKKWFISFLFQGIKIWTFATESTFFQMADQTIFSLSEIESQNSRELGKWLWIQKGETLRETKWWEEIYGKLNV